MLAGNCGPINCGRKVAPDKPRLYDVERHISETHKVAEQHSEITERRLVRIKKYGSDIYRAARRCAGDPALAVTLWARL